MGDGNGSGCLLAIIGGVVILNVFQNIWGKADRSDQRIARLQSQYANLSNQYERVVGEPRDLREQTGYTNGVSTNVSAEVSGLEEMDFEVLK